MRLKYTVVLLLIAVVFTTTTPVTGQEEPLPAIHAKAAPYVALAVEPIRDLAQQTTLVEAARANDFATFDALYRDTPLGAFTMLHELWTFSMNDPVGAFYGQELYERLARAHPDYARFIEEYRIVDSNGNVFYPTSETRAFLLRQALLGTPATAPRVQLAERRTTGTPASAPAEQAASRRRTPEVAVAPVKPRVEARVAPRAERRVEPRVAPRVASVAPIKAAARDAAPSAGEDAGAPQTTVIEENPVVDAKPVVAAPVAVTKPEPATVTVDNNNFASRGIFLLLIGVFGIGILAMMLRAPSEVPKSIMTPPTVDKVEPPAPAAPVEPIRRPASSGKNRANGSRG